MYKNSLWQPVLHYHASDATGVCNLLATDFSQAADLPFTETVSDNTRQYC